MKSLLIFLGIFFVSSCKAQKILPLNTLMKDIPVNAHVKDTNNLLDKYIGTWKGTLNGKNYEFNFIKKENFGFEDN